VSAATAQQGAARVTGGGQVIASTDAQGAGDTLAFGVVETRDGVRGQFQAVETSAAGRDMIRFHGVVTCLEVEGNTARFGGFERGGDQAFTVDVMDNGDGGTDVVVFKTTDEPCGDSDEDPLFGETSLARGNATVHQR
jgi:hypothetical protein